MQPLQSEESTKHDLWIAAGLSDVRPHDWQINTSGPSRKRTGGNSRNHQGPSEAALSAFWPVPCSA
eukprot:3133606-Alexandrium_andersonii.AAC.1